MDAQFAFLPIPPNSRFLSPSPTEAEAGHTPGQSTSSAYATTNTKLVIRGGVQKQANNHPTKATKQNLSTMSRQARLCPLWCHPLQLPAVHRLHMYGPSAVLPPGLLPRLTSPCVGSCCDNETLAVDSICKCFDGVPPLSSVRCLRLSRQVCSGLVCLRLR